MSKRADGKVAVYDREEGELFRFPVDARELVRWHPDRFSYEPWPAAAAEAAEPSEAEAEAEAPKRGPGRPRRHEG